MAKVRSVGLDVVEHARYAVEVLVRGDRPALPDPVVDAAEHGDEIAA